MILKLFGAAWLVPLIAATAPLPQLRIEPMAGGSIFYVKNVAAVPLTGYLVELVDYPGSQYSLWQDDVLDPIAPGAEKRIQVGNMTVGAVPDYVKIQAALYADGSSAGIAEKVRQFTERRKFTLETVRETIGRLGKGGSKDAVIASLKQDAESPLPKGGRDAQAAINRAAANKVLADTAARLGSHSIEETMGWLRQWEKALEASLKS